jgi:hypothetical protein
MLAEFNVQLWRQRVDLLSVQGRSLIMLAHRWFQAGFTALVLLASPAAAQSRDLEPGSVRLSVNIQMFVASDDKDLNAKAEIGRKAMYELGGSECKLILVSMGETCELETMQVQSSVQQRGGNGEPTVSVSGSAQFRVKLKAK